MSRQCSIVIRAYNEEKHIGRLLSGILKQRGVEPEIIFVDSGSTDATRAIAARYPVRLVEIRPEEFSFGRSLNRGCAAASHEAIVVASAHVYPVYPDWLERLLSALEQPGAAVVYGKQRGNASTRFSEHQVFSKWFPDSSNANQGHPFCNNANAAIRKSLWLQRPYDETLPALEDLEWATWAVRQGYRVVYVAEAEVIHVHEETLHQVYNRYRREAMALKRIRPEEHFHLLDFARLFLTNVISDAWHAGHWGGLRGRLLDILGFRWMQFWGTYQGFRNAGPLTSRLKETFYYPRGFRRTAPVGRRDVEPIDYGTQP